MDFELSSEQRQLKELAGRLSDEFRLTAEDVQASGDFPWANIKKLAAAGLLGVTIPEEYGGYGGGLMDAVLLLEELARGCYVTSMAVLGEVGVQSQVLVHFASDAIKKKYLPGVVAGEKILAVCISEPEAGSDAANMTTNAVTVDGGFRINGGKIYISRADVADLFILYTRFDGVPGNKGVGALVVERDTPGFTIGRQDTTMAGERFGQLFFDDCFVPNENLLVKVDGFRTMFNAFNGQRCLNSAICLGTAQGALDEAVAYAKDRRQFGKAIAEFQGLQWMLADMQIEVDAARLLVYRAATHTKDGFPNMHEAAMAKTYTNEMAIRVTNQAMQIFGTIGFVRGTYVERAVRSARFGALGGGTPQILRNLIARHMLR